MADQQVRYVVYIDGTQRAEASLRSMESSANSTERSVTSLNNALRGMASAMGIGLGAHGLFNFAKDAVQDAADYETAVKRIKFASESLEEGITNNAFILAEADKFKIELQGATDSYGKFLAMLSGSGIAGDEVRKLHDELLLIGKVKGLGDGQLDAAVMNLGKMLEAGAMDARHLRPLEMQLSGIGKFIADELGVSVHELAKLRNKGKLTDIDPTILLKAIEKQSKSLEQFLPESTTTIQSSLNDISNAWLKFKTSLVYDNRAELMELFATLKDGIGYLREHKDDIEDFAEVIITLGKAWIAYKGIMLLVNTATKTQMAFMAGYAGESTAVISAAEAQAVAFNSLALAMERVAFATEAMAGASLTGVRGLGALGIPLAGAGGAAAAVGGAEAGTVGAMAGASLVSVVGAVVAVIAGGYFLNELFTAAQKENARTGGAYEYMPDANDPKGFKVVKRSSASGKGGSESPDRSAGALGVASAPSEAMNALGKNFKGFGKFISPADIEAKKAAAQAAGKIKPPTDTVTGQRVITYNISIREINGIKENTVQAGGKMDPKQVAEIVRDEIIGALHDSQIRGGQ